MKELYCFSVDEIFMNSNNIELLVTGGNILAQNQKVPSAWEPCVSSLAISHHLAHRCDQDVAVAQMLARNDGWGQKQRVERDPISACRALWCEPRRPSITAALSFVVGAVWSLWGNTLQKLAARGKNTPLLWNRKGGKMVTDLSDGMFVEGVEYSLKMLLSLCAVCGMMLEAGYHSHCQYQYPEWA